MYPNRANRALTVLKIIILKNIGQYLLNKSRQIVTAQEKLGNVF